MNLHIYYRISDKGNPKEKLTSADKKSCFLNARKEFPTDTFHVIADNCNEDTLQFLYSQSVDIEKTSLGNSASFMHMLNRIIKDHSQDDIVYLLEDDYIHLQNSRAALLEGLALADYVTLYDHPDKYVLEKDGGSPLNQKNVHATRLYLTKSSHWRETDSTTMTFACQVRVLKEDYPTWERYTQERNPDDFHAFMTLTQNSLSDLIMFFFLKRKREFFILLKNCITKRKLKRLISAVPAKATHAERMWLSPVIDWKE